MKPSSKYLIFLIIFSWMGLVGADWFLRFYWYHWHTRLVTSKIASSSGQPITSFRGQGVPLSTIEKEIARGGNLSNLIPRGAVWSGIEEDRPAQSIQYDRYGFLNEPLVECDKYSVVVVGDSFMTAQTHMSNSFPASLASINRLCVYNYSFSAYGPTFSLARFLKDPRFLLNQPSILIWGIAEHSLHGARHWPDLKSSLMDRPAPEVSTLLPRSRFSWQLLSPGKLSSELNSSSALAQFARNQWVWINYHVFGVLPEDIVLSTDKTMLFNAWTIKDMAIPLEQRWISSIVDSIVAVNELLASRGVRLVVLLIPEKEHVYWQRLPDGPLTSLAIAESNRVLSFLESSLNENEVHTVNLLKVFQPLSQENTNLYWRDDTHWKPDGALLAARSIAPFLSELIYKTKSMDKEQ
jgi:hypothetical protein